jgi:hypothetical protein
MHAARAAGAARWAWTTGRGSSSNHGSRPGSSCRSDRCSASSTVRHADGRGQPAPPAQNCDASPARPGASALRAAPAAPRARRRNGPRRRAADRHPTSARPHQPRHHLDLPPRHRQHRDHRLSTPAVRRWSPWTARSRTDAATGGAEAGDFPAADHRRARRPRTNRAASDSENAPFIAKQQSTRRKPLCPDRAKEHLRCESPDYPRQAKSGSATGSLGHADDPDSAGAYVVAGTPVRTGEALNPRTMR